MLVSIDKEDRDSVSMARILIRECRWNSLVIDKGARRTSSVVAFILTEFVLSECRFVSKVLETEFTNT